MPNLILGANGQLGRALQRHLTNFEALSRDDLDVADHQAVSSAFDHIKPTTIYNCAAYTDVDGAETDQEEAQLINANAVHNLAHLCHRHRASLVQFSTDYVFGAEKLRSKPYEVYNPVGPVNHYGLTKIIGELHAKTSFQHYIIRTCGLYDVGSQNFFTTILNKRGELPVVNDQVCAPSYVDDVAEAAIKISRTEKFGTYHVVNGGHCTWYEFAERIVELTSIELRIVPATSDEINRPAKRPNYSVLSTTSYDRLDRGHLRNWMRALKKVVEIWKQS